MQKTLFSIALSAFVLIDHSYASLFEQFEKNCEDFPLGYFQRQSGNINKGLEDIGSPHHMTTKEAFDAEIMKALDPKTYIPFAVEKSVTMDFRMTPEGWTQFTRLSVQRDFRDPSLLAYVKERVTIDAANLQIIFMGEEVTHDDIAHLAYRGEKEFAADTPPLFDVRHAINVNAGQPYDSWTMVRHIQDGDEDPSVMEGLRAALSQPEVFQRAIENIYGKFLHLKHEQN